MPITHTFPSDIAHRVSTTMIILRPGLCFISTLFIASFLNAADAVLLTGKTVKGTITAVDTQFLSMKEDGGAVIRLSVKELAVVDFGGKPLEFKSLSFDEIELVDGSLLRVQRPDEVQKTLFQGKKVVVATLPGPKDVPPPTIDLPLTTIYYLMRSAHDPSAQASWKTALSKREKRDVLLIRTGETQQRLLGTVIEGNDTGEVITFQDEKGEKLPFKLARVNVGLIFNQPRETIPPTICKVVDVFGNTLVATGFSFEGSGVKITTVSGAAVIYPKLECVARLDFSQSNVTSLTSLTPVVTAPDDLIELALTYTIDKTRLGKSLQLGGKTYSKGLFVYGGVTLAYKLGGDYREFKAVVGVDDSIEIANSKVKLSIIGDGRTLKNFPMVISRKDKPTELVLDVKDVNELKIVVEQDEPFFANSVNLCEVRVQK